MKERNKKKQDTASCMELQIDVAIKKPKADKGGTWKENLGKYFIDLSKYMATGVVITSAFSNLKDGAMIYILGVVFSVVALVVGLVLTNKKKGE